MTFLLLQERLYTGSVIHGGIFIPHSIWGDPKMVEYNILSKLSDSIKFALIKYLQLQIVKITPAFVSYFLTFLTPISSLVPQKSLKKYSM